MVVFDATILLALLHPGRTPPRHPETGEPIEGFRERIDYLVSSLEKDSVKIIIPTPALSEVLVRADDAAGRYLDMINSAAVFRPVPFDARCAVEVAEMTRNALDAGDKRHGSDATYAKIKYDRQIVATAKVEGAKIIYSDDRGVYNLGARNELTVLRIADLPLPPENPQTSLQLGTENEEAKAETTD